MNSFLHFDTSTFTRFDLGKPLLTPFPASPPAPPQTGRVALRKLKCISLDLHLGNLCLRRFLIKETQMFSPHLFVSLTCGFR